MEPTKEKVYIRENSILSYELRDKATGEVLDSSIFRMDMVAAARRMGEEVVRTYCSDGKECVECGVRTYGREADKK